MPMRITRAEPTKILLNEIDQARCVNETEFIDRFGLTLPMLKLSTEYRAFLVVAHNPTKVVDLTECGYNAGDIIIRSMRDGNVLFYYDDTSMDYPGFNNFAVDVLIDGKWFTSLDNLNLYLSWGM